MQYCQLFVSYFWPLTVRAISWSLRHWKQMRISPSFCNINQKFIFLVIWKPSVKKQDLRVLHKPKQQQQKPTTKASKNYPGNTKKEQLSFILIYLSSLVHDFLTSVSSSYAHDIYNYKKNSPKDCCKHLQIVFKKRSWAVVFIMTQSMNGTKNVSFAPVPLWARHSMISIQFLPHIGPTGKTESPPLTAAC